jgi:hypothetical protein
LRNGCATINLVVLDLVHEAIVVKDEDDSSDETDGNDEEMN